MNNPSIQTAIPELLDSTPVRNRSAKNSRGSGGELILRVPLQRRWYMSPPISWLLPFSGERAVSLDRFGEEVWNLCDGDKTIEKIVELFSCRHHLTFHEARLSVSQFLKDLTRRGLVVIAGPPKA